MTLPHPMRTVPRERSRLRRAPVAPALRSHGPRPTPRAFRRLARAATLFGVVCTIALRAAPPTDAAPLTYQMVTVGDPGMGNVAAEFRIGTYEVTIGQYTAFLNAVAATDTYGLYDPLMASTAAIAGIVRSGASGGYSYGVTGPGGITPTGASSAANRPITYVSWFDAARFANWMANGQPTGLQSNTTTENGAYGLFGLTSGTSPAPNSTNPNTGSAPAYFIPTEAQWRKAAYFSPVLNSGSGGFHDYATQSNAIPANVIGSAPNSANYRESTNAFYSVTQSSGFGSSQNYLTDAGAFGSSASWYGTYDQNGNVREWNDSFPIPDRFRGVLGGDWQSSYLKMRSSWSETELASNSSETIGFRLAAPATGSPGVPEIDPAGLGSALALLAGVLSLRERVRHRCRTRPDGTAAIASPVCPAVHPHAR